MTRAVDLRFKLLRKGAEYGELYALESGTPVLRMNDSGDIKTSLSGEFVTAPDANWLTDEIKPILVVDGEDHPLGVFLPATVKSVEDETTKSVRIEAYDRCWLLRDCRTEGFFYIARGTNYLTPIKQLLSRAGVALCIETPTSLTLATDREDWEIGTSYLSIINQLLSEINYKPLWFDSEGYAILEPYRAPVAANIRHTLDNDTVKSLLLPEISREMDVYSTPNVFICVVSSADRAAVMIAKAENNNPSSPISIARRGRRITGIYRVDNIASQAELQAYADRLCNESLLTGETISVQTALLGGYGVADIVALRYGDLSDLCVEHGYSMELKPGGTMTHNLERVVVNLG